MMTKNNKVKKQKRKKHTRRRNEELAFATTLCVCVYWHEIQNQLFDSQQKLI